MPQIFQDILKQGSIAGKTGKQAVDWLRKLAMNASRVNLTLMINEAEPFKRIQKLNYDSIGKMYMFENDPKLKITLPYYDRYPLIFPLEFKGDRMIGLNFHYLPPILRAKLMDALYETINNKEMNETTKLKIRYSTLKGASRYEYFKPCVKEYIFSHVRSPFIYIAPIEWDIALMLPSERFAKQEKQAVWQKSLNSIGK